MQAYMAAAIGPRPIALASTISAKGVPNLSPFSFYNSFGINPPILVFSPSRRARDNTTKHTFENIKQIPEVAIHAVSYSMVQQVNLSSVEFDEETDEFEKAGFTRIPSDLIKPFRVQESPVHFECQVINIIETGKEGGAGNLIICKVLKMHIQENILNENNSIDQNKIDLVGRLGGNLYCRASGDALFSVPKPIGKKAIGIDALPEKIKFNKLLTGNELGKLGILERFPSLEEINECAKKEEIKNYLNSPEALIQIAKEKIKTGEAFEALKILLLL